jgi:hypothetical protein
MGNGGGGGGGVQQSLSMLCDVAVGDQVGKRTALDDLYKPEASKRHKSEPGQISKENPVLMERLRALGGGFPMPNWGGGFKRRSKPKEVQAGPKQLTSKLGAFPLPPLKGRKSLNMVPSLSSYKDLWQGTTDHELRKEILVRKLHYGNVKMMEGRRRHGI